MVLPIRPIALGDLCRNTIGSINESQSSDAVLTIVCMMTNDVCASDRAFGLLVGDIIDSNHI